MKSFTKIPIVTLLFSVLLFDSRAELTEAQATKATAEAESSLESQLKGFGFSAGIAAVFMSGQREVENAAVEGGLLRVDYKSKNRLGGFIEAHQLFGQLTSSNARQTAKRERIKSLLARGAKGEVLDFAPGIMVGAELGENAIRSLGIGPIFAWHRLEVGADGSFTKKVAFNLGAMILIEQNVKMLADGFETGKALPAGATAARFKNDSRTGFALTFSAGF